MIPRTGSDLGAAGEPDEWLNSARPVCSNGCGLDIAVKDGRIVGMRGRPDHPVGFGHPGPERGHARVADGVKRRGIAPTIRRNPGARLRLADRAGAMAVFGRRVRDAWRRGHHNLARGNSGRPTSEDLDMLGEFGRGGRSANRLTWHALDPVSHRPRLRSSSVAARRPRFGEPEPRPLERLAERADANIEPFAARSFG